MTVGAGPTSYPGGVTTQEPVHEPRPARGRRRRPSRPTAPDGNGAADGQEQVTRPTKLIRIASMVRSMLDEVRRAPLDDAGRKRLREIHERSIVELEGVLSPDLQQELDDVVLPFTDETPSESELRLAQAQLVGWLEGLFHGIQATLFTQQAMAQSQLDEMRRRRDRARRRPRRTGRPHAGAAERIPVVQTPAPLTMFGADWTPDSWQSRPADQQPDWPDADALEAALDRAPRPPAARVRGRGPAADRVASRPWPRARASCSTRATAPSRSTRSPPTPSATSSRSSCRCRWCSPTAPACRR